MLGFLVFGLVVGILARWFLPGRQHISIRMTVLLGLIGSVVGGLAANAIGTGDILELNIVGSIVAILASIVLIVVCDRLGIGRRGDAR